MTVMPWQVHRLPRNFIRCERSYVIVTVIVPWQQYHLPHNFIHCKRSYVIATTIVPWQQYHLPRNFIHCHGSYCHVSNFVAIDHIATHSSSLAQFVLQRQQHLICGLIYHHCKNNKPLQNQLDSHILIIINHSISRHTIEVLPKITNE